MLKLDELKGSTVFKGWSQGHQGSFLSHFFCQIDSSFALKGKWEIGFYSPDKDKISTFVVDDEFTLKPDESVFKKPDGVVSELKLDGVMPYEEAKEKVRGEFGKLFPSEQLGDGFVILQNIEKVMWNFTLMSKTLKFLNVKIDAVNGEVVGHQAVELVQK